MDQSTFDPEAPARPPGPVVAETDPLIQQPEPATAATEATAPPTPPINLESVALANGSKVETPSSIGNTVLSYLERAYALLQVLETTGVVSTPDGATITQILGDLEAVISSAQAPSDALIQRVTQLLNDLQTAGIIKGAAVEAIAGGLTQFSAFVADIKNGQVGVIKSHASLDGVEGLYCFVPYGGPAAEALGL